MEVAFFTEMGFRGKVPRTHRNQRTEFSWMCATDADHWNLADVPDRHYDLAILITPKNNPTVVDVDRIKKYADRVGVMQEGPSWFFQDYSLENQIHYFNNLKKADIIFVHNEQDKLYYQGLTGHPKVNVLRSLMITDTLENKCTTSDRNGVMIGGNMKSWYGGFDSFVLAKSIEEDIYQPRMGRRQEGEEALGINQLPYLEWTDWVIELSKRKIGVHMMRVWAAGTFAMNCGFLGIPCIGYDYLDTQRILHPQLTIKDGDMVEAKRLIKRLNEDEKFYQECSNVTQKRFKEYYSENAWKSHFYSQLQ